MTLRLKTLILISLVLTALIIAESLITSTLFLEGVQRIEKQFVQENVRRFFGILNANLEGMDRPDWARWDEAYKFMDERNQKFIDENLVPQTYADLHVQEIGFYRLDGKAVWAYGIDAEKKELTPPHAELTQCLQKDILPRCEGGDIVQRGVLLFKEGPMLVVWRPIVKSDGTGPSHGVFVQGRWLDHAELEKLSRLEGFPVSIQPLSPESTPIQGEREWLLPCKEDDEFVIGAAALQDLFEKKILDIQVKVPRVAHAQGARAVKYMLWSVIVAGLLFGGTILLLLERAVLRPLSQFAGLVSAIGASSGISTRLLVTGKDELSLLAASVNKMLTAIELYHREIQEHHQELRLIMDTIPVGLLSLDEHNLIRPEYSKSVEALLGLESPAGMDFCTALRLGPGRDHDCQTIREYLEQVRTGTGIDCAIEEINPFSEFQITLAEGSASRWLKIGYDVIDRGPTLKKHILVVIEDISEVKVLADRFQQAASLVERHPDPEQS